jgi:hypothetical protein
MLQISKNRGSAKSMSLETFLKDIILEGQIEFSEREFGLIVQKFLVEKNIDISSSGSYNVERNLKRFFIYTSKDKKLYKLDKKAVDLIFPGIKKEIKEEWGKCFG